MLRRAKPQHLLSLEDVCQTDPRPPVLYLRAFTGGLQLFILGNAMAGEGNPHHDAAGIRDRLEQLGYDEIKVADPGAGAVLASMHWAKDSFVLTTEGNWPQDFARPTEAWITERKKIGRWVASKCAKCGRDIYGCQSESARRFATTVAPERSREARVAAQARSAMGLLLVDGAFALTVIVAMIFPGRWVDRWSGCLFIAMLPLVLVATLVSSRKKSRSES
jgi:hypothetical protein